MTKNTSLDIVQQYYGKLAEGDQEGALAILSQDVVWNPPGPENILPWKSEYKGRDGIAEFLGVCAEVTAEDIIDIQGVVAQDGKVVLIAHQTITAKSTGKTLKHYLVAIHTVCDDKISHCRLMEDSYGLTQIFG
jgi:ketosteroid isomerase-like protein